jgi:DNA-binding MarR family transcriptional regulator
VSETRWLNQEEQRTWRAFLAAIQLLQSQLDRELQAGAGMPLAYYVLLAMLSEAPERMLRMSDLAQMTQFSRSRLSHAVDKLEQLGWVERLECPTDARGAFARLTDAGFAVLRRAAHSHVEGVRTHLFDQLAPEQVAHLRDISEAVVQHLSHLDH